MKHKSNVLHLVAVLLSLALLMAGCGTETPGLDSTESQSALDSTDPTHFYEELAENITIDAVVDGRIPGQIPAVHEGTIPPLNREVVDRFLAGIGDSVVQVVDEKSTEKSWLLNARTELGGYVSTLINTSTTAITTSTFTYSSAEEQKYSVPVNYYSPYWRALVPRFDNSEVYMEPRSISFATVEEADDQVRDWLALLGIHNVELEEILYLDHQTLAEQEQVKMSSSKEGQDGTNLELNEWTEADDAYHLFYEVGHEGIHMIPIPLDEKRPQPYNSTEIRVICNRNGIVWLYVETPWIFGEQVEVGETLLTAQEAMEKTKEILLLAPAPYEQIVDRISLRYYYQQDGDRHILRPCWVASVLGVDVVKFEGADQINEYSYIILDAYTGQEL